MNTLEISSARHRSGKIALVGLGLLCLMWLGVMIGVQGASAVILLGGILGAAILLLNPFVGAVAFVATVPIEAALMVEGMTATRMLGIGLFGAWFVNKIVRRESWEPIASSSFIFIGAGFVGLVLASTLWADYPDVTVRGFVQLLQLFAWSVLLIDLASSWKRVDILARTLVLGAVFAAMFTVQQSFFGGARRAGEAVSGGVNGTAVVLLTIVPFGFYLFRSQSSALWRFVGLGYVVLAVVAIAVTFSRMNFLLLPPLLLALSWDTLRGRGRGGWLIALIMVAIVTGSFFVPWDRVQERAETITPYVSATFQGGSAEMPSTSGRGFHLRVGLAIARDHPLLGVGYNNYGFLFLHQYQFQLAGTKRLYTSARSAHSSHIGILADLGIVGLLLWLALLGVCLANVFRAWRNTRQRKRAPPHIFVQAVCYALLVHVLAYGFYLPNQKEKILWTLLGLSVVVGRLAVSHTWRTGSAGDRVELMSQDPVRPAVAAGVPALS